MFLKVKHTDALIAHDTRALTEHPQTHHAVHLAKIRKEVSTNPLSILRAFRNSKAPKRTVRAPSGSVETEDPLDLDNIEEEGQTKPKKEKKSWLSFGSSSKGNKFLAKGSHENENDT